ncbi:MAG: hypothetical protein V4592_13810 [Bacteroidota bacterium]
MKTSSKIFLALLVLIVFSTLLVDLSLKSAYQKIRLDDPFKNYETMAVQPFHYLYLKGGNSYAIVFSQATKPTMKVMSSRKTFLTSTRHGDTLFIEFRVAGGSTKREPESLPRGLLIGGPAVREIQVDGSAVSLSNWKTDNLKVTLGGNASAGFDYTHITQLTINGNHNSICNFTKANYIGQFNLSLKHSSVAFLSEISYTSFIPQLRDSSLLIFNAATAAKLKK